MRETASAPSDSSSRPAGPAPADPALADPTLADPALADVGLALLPREEILIELENLPEWRLSRDGRTLHRTFCFATYQETIEFVLKAARLFHSERHYPVLRIDQNCVDVECHTVFVDGVTENDVAIASRLDTAHFVHLATAAHQAAPNFNPAGGRGCSGACSSGDGCG